MKNNYDIRFNPKGISSEEIARHQDFDALLNLLDESKPEAPTQRPVVRRMYIWGGAVAAAVIGALLLFGLNNTSPDYATQMAEHFNTKPYIDKPLNQIKPQFASYKVNANKGGVFEYKNGSRLVVPKAAFVNDKGALIEGEVDLQYREYHDYVDFFVSGIPMYYDSLGTRYTLESAGMMEIFAEKDGKRVKMAPNKTIAVELVSEIDVPNLEIPPAYNIYKLDEKARNWVYQDADRIEVIKEDTRTVEGQLKAIDKAEQRALADLEAKYPMPKAMERPMIGNPDLPSFNHENIASFFPEGHGIADGTIWQSAPGQTYTQADLNKAWDDLKVKKISANKYELTLIKADETINWIVNPVLDGAAYQAAMAGYNAQKANYDKAIAARAEGIAAEKASIIESYAAQRSAQSNTPVGLDAIDTKRKVINKFVANSLGIWNCDRPLAPKRVNVKAGFQDEQGQALKGMTGYLVDRKLNTKFEFLATDATELSFDANSDNILWIVTEDDQIAIFKAADFKNLNTKKGTQTLQLERLNATIETEADVRKILKFK